MQKNLTTLTLCTFILACGASGPQSFPMGERPCQYCKMNIVDPRFKAEAISTKGKISYFDSIECLRTWVNEHQQSVRSQWVSDAARPEIWLALDKALILKSDRLASPMGAGFSAYANREELEKAASEFGGREIGIGELDLLVERKPPKP